MQNSFVFLVGMIKGTPWWVYLVFVWLMIRGIQGLYSRRILLYRIFILPLVFLGLTLIPFFKGGASSLTIAWYVSALLFGLLDGFLLTLRDYIIVDRKRRLITVPGSCVTLTLVGLIFIVRYYLGYNVTVCPGFKETTTFFVLSYGFGGFVEGFTWGRVLSYLYRYVKAA